MPRGYPLLRFDTDQSRRSRQVAVRALHAKASEGAIAKGQQIYSSWNINRKYFWTKSEYEHPGFAAVYASKLWEDRVVATLEGLKTLVQGCPKLHSAVFNMLKKAKQEWVTLDGPVYKLSLVSIGAGPGCCCVAMRAFLQVRAAPHCGPCVTKFVLQVQSMRVVWIDP